MRLHRLRAYRHSGIRPVRSLSSALAEDKGANSIAAADPLLGIISGTVFEPLPERSAGQLSSAGLAWTIFHRTSAKINLPPSWILPNMGVRQSGFFTSFRTSGRSRQATPAAADQRRISCSKLRRIPSTTQTGCLLEYSPALDRRKTQRQSSVKAALDMGAITGTHLWIKRMRTIL